MYVCEHELLQNPPHAKCNQDHNEEHTKPYTLAVSDS
jgi:hypothetical protein